MNLSDKVREEIVGYHLSGFSFNFEGYSHGTIMNIIRYYLKGGYNSFKFLVDLRDFELAIVFAEKWKLHPAIYKKIVTNKVIDMLEKGSPGVSCPISLFGISSGMLFYDREPKGVLTCENIIETIEKLQIVRVFDNVRFFDSEGKIVKYPFQYYAVRAETDCCDIPFTEKQKKYNEKIAAEIDEHYKLMDAMILGNS